MAVGVGVGVAVTGSPWAWKLRGSCGIELSIKAATAAIASAKTRAVHGSGRRKRALLEGASMNIIRN